MDTKSHGLRVSGTGVFQSPPIPAKRYFKISEASELCGVKPHVLRYWEQEFPLLEPIKRRGNRRYYLHHHLLLIRRIRELLYDQGFTVGGAQARLREALAGFEKPPPFHVELIGIGRTLSEKLKGDSSLIYQLTPDQFEEFVCERLFAMGFEPRRVGAVNAKDGGVDVVFWPRVVSPISFLGAAQIKHHRNPKVSEGPRAVRDFAGTLAGHPFNAGVLVTNTTFSPDAKWFAREHAQLMRLRELSDIQRLLQDDFNDEAEMREIPTSLELCPGVVIKIR